ncbi:MAG: EAL domain-containing protein, partial [Gemmatimonadales bacterium]|nr:EAL domain-containing protein [Gemmatimonadales bacterium]
SPPGHVGPQGCGRIHMKGFRISAMASASPVYRLLFLDQDPDLAERLRGATESRRRPSLRLAHYTHLNDALTYLKVNPVDLILVGSQPPEVDSAKAVAKINQSFPELPIIGLLEMKGGREEARIREAGALECLAVGDLESDLSAKTFEFCLRERDLNRELASVTARFNLLANTDTLTGLLNRKGLERVILDELGRCRDQEEEPVVLLVDLDDFSRLSATLGHGVGDLVLMAAARRISESIGPQDKVGRCGIDRFMVMLSDSTVAAGEIIAEKIRLAISRDVIQAGEHSLTTTASLGLIAVNPDSMSFDEVLSKAHFVLQCSKLEGKNRVTRGATIEEVGMIRPVAEGPDMVQALLRGNVFQIKSQPIVKLGDGRIVSHEMLVRGPEGPLRRPDNLFRYCQEKDILTAVDLRCLKKCAAAAMLASGGGDYHVNIMPTTLLQTPAEELIRVLRFPSGEGRCCLEISEQQLLHDPSVLVPRTRILQKAGIRIAIDDVGFGHSCLEGLIMLQPQVMKVDKRLIQGVAKDQELRQSLRRLLKVADVLEAEVVAEGIEKDEDCQALLDLGVKYGQGFLFGEPELCVKMEKRAAASGRTSVQPPASSAESSLMSDYPEASGSQ